MTSLQNQLRNVDYQGDAASFRDLLADLFSATYPSWTDEKLTYNPKEAITFCDLVRRRAGIQVSDEFILKALTGIRKHTIKV